jgi:predicted hydroxymethylglutaryl-CoA synthase/degradative hydroxymethylglutaryl-CoA reductase
MKAIMVTMSVNEEKAAHSSRIPGFYKLSLSERAGIVGRLAGLNEDEQALLCHGGLQATQADKMIENALGTYALPLGVAVNFAVNGRDYLVPMAVEEPSVLAAVSHSAKLARAAGGFTAETTDPIMIGQIQVLDVPDMTAAVEAIRANEAALMEAANASSQAIVNRGGGARGVEARPFPATPVGPMLVVHLLYDTRDAMGANAINTAVEAIGPLVARLTGGRTNLRILSNLTDRRLATARCTILAGELEGENGAGADVARLIEEANAFAVVDPYRAATHNKGIMNGIDAVCIATGNDWRAVEAGAHAYAARSGRYSALTDWRVDAQGNLRGQITLPLAVGIVGGATKVHPTAKVALKILGVESAAELAAVMAAVGLAQNLAAIRALATTGIQKGHMRLHARQVALAAGANGADVDRIASRLVAENNIRVERAREILKLSAQDEAFMAEYNPENGLMRPDRPVGIVGYGAYVPRYRLPATEVAKMWTGGQGGVPIKEKAVNGLDEDVVSMSIEAARNALDRAQIDPQLIRAVWVGSESHPYAVKPTSTIVAEAIGAVPNTQAADWEFACKAGTEAMQAAIGFVGSGMARYALSIGMDTAQGRPGDALEYTAAAGGAAMLIGPADEAAALIEGSYSFVTDTPDFWRRAHANYPSHGDRFTGEPAYFKHVTGAAEALMAAVGRTAADYAWAVFHQPNVKFPERAAKGLGFSAEQIKPGLLSGRIGNTYAGSSMIGLTALLDVARPGDRILVVSYGSGAGSDAFDILVTELIDEVRDRAPKTEEYIARRIVIDYATYTRFRDKLKLS